jgi:hypothetical protein
MKSNTRRVGVATLVLVVCLAISPAAAAVQPNDASVSIRETITRILKKLKKIGSIGVLQDFPGPPKP